MWKVFVTLQAATLGKTHKILDFWILFFLPYQVVSKLMDNGNSIGDVQFFASDKVVFEGDGYDFFSWVFVFCFLFALTSLGRRY